MKNLHRLESQTAGPVWGLVFGVFVAAVGIGLWWYAESSHSSRQTDESVAIAAVLVGVFAAVYAGREMFHRRKR